MDAGPDTVPRYVGGIILVCMKGEGCDVFEVVVFCSRTGLNENVGELGDGCPHYLLQSLRSLYELFARTGLQVQAHDDSVELT